MKFGIKYVIHHIVTNFTQKKDIYVTGLKVPFLACVYFTDQNIIQWKDPMELNFEGLEMKHIN